MTSAAARSRRLRSPPERVEIVLYACLPRSKESISSETSRQSRIPSYEARIQFRNSMTRHFAWSR